MRRPALILPALAALACSAGAEPERIGLPVTLRGDRLGPCTTDLGWQVQLTAVRMALADLELTVGGEAHARRLRWTDLLLPSAQAHPGHWTGGEVTGELRGRWVARWAPLEDGRLGDATLLAGDYQGANFTFGRAGRELGVGDADPLLGHTAHLEGSVQRDGRSTPLEAVVDVEAGAALVGAPFRARVDSSSSGALALRLSLEDPVEAGTLFDGIDFSALEAGGRVSIRPGDAAHAVLRRKLQIHDHYGLEVVGGAGP